MKIIAICCSANFYKHANDVAAELEKRGFNAVVPATARKMHETNNYNTDDYKTWYKNADDIGLKTERMRGHFDEVDRADAILVINDEKKGIKGYIGPNTLMEMGLAFFQRKPVYVLNAINEEHPNWEEVVGLGSIILEGDLDKVKL